MNLKEPIKNYAHQEKIDPNRVKKILAATLTYNLDIPTIIRFLGGNYTGEYRNIHHTINSLHELKYDPSIIEEIKTLLTKGFPQNLTHTRHGKILWISSNMAITHQSKRI